MRQREREREEERGREKDIERERKTEGFRDKRRTDRQPAKEREKVVRRVWKARNEEESERERDENIRCGTK